MKNITTTLLTRNTDTVEAGGYLTVLTTGTTLGLANPGRWFLNINNESRIRQNGSITKIKFSVGCSGETVIYFQVYRKDGATYDLVGEEDVTSKIICDAVTHIITVVLTTPISVIEGDFICLGGIPGTGTGAFRSTDVTTANSIRWLTSTKPAATNVAFDGGTGSNYVIPCKVYMQAPMVIGTGNSIVAGHPAHYSYIENSLTSSVANQILYQLEAIDYNYVYQNMGYGGFSSSNVKNYFNANVLLLKPSIAIIEGGVNDISGGTITRATFLANYKEMLDSCESQSIIPVVLKIMPWTAGDSTQMEKMEWWNEGLDSLVATYADYVWVDLDDSLGMFRATGPVGNLWDIKTALNVGDNVHFNLAGYTIIARTIDAEIKKKYRFE
jgi:lysophospholipase L1-like esterase